MGAGRLDRGSEFAPADHRAGPSTHFPWANTTMYVSPELAALFMDSHVQPAFADHDTLFATFHMPEYHQTICCWPMPALIPWEGVQLDGYYAQSGTPPVNISTDLTGSYRRLFGSLEEGVHQQLRSQGDEGLPSAAWGRGSHLHPIRRQQQAPIAKPSREGEVRLSSDLLGRAVLSRFKQLRRLQSLLHNLRADGTGPTHLAYRVETWAAIKAARGFHLSFAEWWPTRLHKLQGAPDTLPAGASLTGCGAAFLGLSGQLSVL